MYLPYPLLSVSDTNKTVVLLFDIPAPRKYIKYHKLKSNLLPPLTCLFSSSQTPCSGTCLPLLTPLFSFPLHPSSSLSFSLTIFQYRLTPFFSFHSTLAFPKHASLNKSPLQPPPPHPQNNPFLPFHILRVCSTPVPRRVSRAKKTEKQQSKWVQHGH